MPAIKPYLYEPKGSPGESDGGRRTRGNFLGVASFEAVANGDTWDSGRSGVTEFSYRCTSVSLLLVTESGGVFTFLLGGVSPAVGVKLYVWGSQ